MDSFKQSLDDLLDLVQQDGLIDAYETSPSDVTFYQQGGSYSLQRESALDFVRRIVRALDLQRPLALDSDETAA